MQEESPLFYKESSIERLEKKLIMSLFKTFNLMLSYQPISLAVYQIILFVEFTQLIYFMFIKVEISNEYTGERSYLMEDIFYYS